MNKQGEHAMEKIKFCSNCGAKIENGASFCTNCGARLIGGNINQPYTQQGMINPQKNKGNLAPKIIIAFAVLVGLAVITFGGVKLGQNIAKENKAKKEKADIENAITEAFDKAKNASEFTCSIKADETTKAHVGSTLMDGTYTVSTNANFKGKKALWEN